MSTVRVYVPSTLALLRGIVAAEGIGPAPFVAYAVTEAVRAADPDGGEEDWEYAATAAAAQAALGLIGEGDAPRRVVVAADVAAARTAESSDEPDPARVQVEDVVPFRRIAAVLVDDEGAERDVAAAVRAWAAAEAGDAAAEETVERCLDHDLGWWATQEVDALLDDL